jgi:hypothetical protein
MSSTETQLKNVAQLKAPTKNTVEKVALHILCQNCTTFFRQWAPLQAIMIPQSSKDWPDSSYLCNVTQLVESHQHCHFCKLLLASLDRQRFVKRKDVLSMSVWLHFQEKAAKAATVSARVSEQQPLKERESRHIAEFALGSYEGMYDWSFG